MTSMTTRSGLKDFFSSGVSFAWKHADRSGVDEDLTVHFLYLGQVEIGIQHLGQRSPFSGRGLK